MIDTNTGRYYASESSLKVNRKPVSQPMTKRFCVMSLPVCQTMISGEFERAAIV